MPADEMVGWHHWLNGHESEDTQGDGGGPGSLVCCNAWGLKESDTTERLNNNKFLFQIYPIHQVSLLRCQSFIL